MFVIVIVGILTGIAAALLAFNIRPDLIGYLTNGNIGRLEGRDDSGNSATHWFLNCTHRGTPCGCRCMGCHRAIRDIVGDGVLTSSAQSYSEEGEEPTEIGIPLDEEAAKRMHDLLERMAADIQGRRAKKDETKH